tara:strand:+ start:512 stop:1318 length:807 start_codon:yes stop_codon:yes gene_type:complete
MIKHNKKTIIIITLVLILIIINYLGSNKIDIANEEEHFNNVRPTNIIHKMYFINLDRHPDRKKYMLDQFNREKLSVIRFKAFDKKLIDDAYLDNLINNKMLDSKEHIIKKKKQGSLACLTSHTNLYKEILNDGEGDDNIYLIFEDDCKLMPNFLNEVNKYIQHLPNDWDMVWLGYNNVKGKKINPYFYKPPAGFNWKHNSQHHCYLVNKKGIKKVLKILFPVKNNFMNKDTVLKMNFDKFNPYFLYKRLAVQDMDEFPISDRTGERNG